MTFKTIALTIHLFPPLPINKETYPRSIGVVSSKQELSMRRIKLKANQQVYQLRPDFIMPYMVGKTDIQDNR